MISEQELPAAAAAGEPTTRNKSLHRTDLQRLEIVRGDVVVELDISGDGIVTRRSCKRSISASTAWPDEVLDEIFAGWDIDKSQELTFDEWPTSRARRVKADDSPGGGVRRVHLREGDAADGKGGKSPSSGG